MMQSSRSSLCLFRIFDGSKNEAIMEKALELVSGFISEYKKIESFSLLLPYMDEQRKEEILEQALESAFNLKDKCMKAQALSAIIPHLDESKQKEISEKTFYFKYTSSMSIFVGEPLLFCEEQRLFHLWPHILMSLVLYMDESRQAKISEKAVYFKYEVQSKYIHEGS